MPFDRKEYIKKWKEENREHIKEYNKEYDKEYYAKHRERYLEQAKKYNKEHKEQKKEYEKEYRQREQSIKSKRIRDWKYNGLICEDYDKLYELYINTWECDNCGIELVEGNYGSNKKCMDHNHKTGIFRNILCNKCNTTRPNYEPD